MKKKARLFEEGTKWWQVLIICCGWAAMFLAIVAKMG